MNDRIRHATQRLSSIVHEHGDASAMVGWFGGTALYYPPQTLSARLEQMSKVSIDDVVNVAREVLSPDRLVLSSVGTLSRARLGELKQIINGWT